MASYIVKAGDSLSKIARDVLGDIKRWPAIAALNDLRQPYTILPGQVLQLPGTDVADVDVKLIKAGFKPTTNWWLLGGLALAGGGVWWWSRNR